MESRSFDMGVGSGAHRWPAGCAAVHPATMRTAAAIDQGVSYADYLRLEATGDAKHEWLDGVVYAMAGGTLEHSALSASVITLLTIALRGRPCRVFTSRRAGARAGHRARHVPRCVGRVRPHRARP